MFFNKHKKYARQLGQAMMRVYKLPLMERLSVSDDVEFPRDFWKDPYMIGHFFNSVVSTLAVDPETAKLSSAKKTEIMLIVSQMIHGDDAGFVIDKIDKYSRGEYDDIEEFLRGKHDALLSFMVGVGKIPSEADEPILKEAAKLAKDINYFSQDSTNPNSDNLDLSAAIIILTLAKHIKAKYSNTSQDGNA